MKRFIAACLLTTACGTAVVGEERPVGTIATHTIKIWARPDTWVAARVRDQPWRRLTTTFADHFELHGVSDRYSVIIGGDRLLVFDATAAQLPEIVVGYASSPGEAILSVDVVGQDASSTIELTVGGDQPAIASGAPLTFDMTAWKGLTDVIAIEKSGSEILGLKIERDLTTDTDRRLTIDLGTDAIRPARATATLVGVEHSSAADARLVTANGGISLAGAPVPNALEWYRLPPGLARPGDRYVLGASGADVSVTRFFDATADVPAQTLDLASIPRLAAGVVASHPARFTGLTFAGDVPTLGYVAHLSPRDAGSGIVVTMTPGAIDGGVMELELPTALEGFDPTWTIPSGENVFTIEAIAATHATMATYFMTQEGEIQRSRWSGRFTSP